MTKLKEEIRLLTRESMPLVLVYSIHQMDYRPDNTLRVFYHDQSVHLVFFNADFYLLF